MNNIDPELSIDNFSLKNSKDLQVIYRTEDPSINVLRFCFINKTGADVNLKGGKPAKPGLLNGQRKLSVSEEDGSTFNFDFQSLLSVEKAKGLEIDPPGDWAAAFFPGDDSYPPSWSMAPVKNKTVKPNDRVEFTIRKVTCTQTEPASFEILYSNIPGFSDPMFSLVFHLAVENPPDKDKKTLPLQFGYTDVVHPISGQGSRSHNDLQDGVPVPIYITYDPKALIENGFTFLLTNTSKAPLVPSPESDSSDRPVLYISFMFGNVYYDITTQELADNGKITIDVSPAETKWETVSHTPSTAYWPFLPKSSSVMAGNETVKFIIHNIITPLNVNAGAISTMYIQFNNVPDYNDASYTLLLEKRKAIAAISEYSVTPREIKFGDNVSLTWRTELARRVTLEYLDRDGVKIFLDSDKGKIRLNASGFLPPTPPTAELTRFLLTAYGDGDQTELKSCEVTVEQPVASIVLFTATPMLVEANKTDSVLLDWEVKNAIRVILRTPEGPKQVDSKKGTLSVNVTNTYEFILEAYSYGTKYPAPTESQVRVYAYRQGQPISQAYAGDAMQTWPTILINDVKSLMYVLNASKNLVTSYDLKMKNLVPVNSYAANAMALSWDGTKFFTYNTDPNNFGVNMFKTDTNEKSNTCGFGPVYLMLPTPNINKLFCAATHSCNTVTAVNIDTGKNNLTTGATITVGTSPRAMIFNKDAGKLYVANYDSQSVTVIRVSDNSVLKTIPLQTKEPNSFVYHKDKEKLYVACEGSNYVEVINTANDIWITKIEVKNRPSKLLISPNGRFVYVANFGGNSISVIDSTTDLVVSTLPVGNGPIAMALNGDNNVFFVGNYCDKSLSVVDLATNTVLKQTLSTGDGSGNPFDMAVYNEGNEYTRVYIAKEIFPPRISCANPGKTNLDVAVYSVQKPGH